MDEGRRRRRRGREETGKEEKEEKRNSEMGAIMTRRRIREMSAAERCKRFCSTYLLGHGPPELR